MTPPRWQHRTLDDAARLPAEPEALTPAEAQLWCNFVLWEPTVTPEGTEVTATTLRREAPPGRPDDSTAGRTPWSDNNPSATRTDIRGGGRALRIKQFFYDWAFPAADHPCLWESRTHAEPVDDTHVLWFGTDYKGNPATSARMARTTVELSVLEGDFTEGELLALHRGLRPAVAEAVAAVAATPWAELSYWARRPEAEKLLVPIGLWTFTRLRAHRTEWAEAASEDRPHGHPLPARLGGLALDSAARVGDPEGRLDVEAVWSGGPTGAGELRAVVQDAGRGPISLPASAEKHPASHEEVTVPGTALTAQLGWIDERFGPFHCALALPGGDGVPARELMLLSGTGVGRDRGWFLDALAELATVLGTGVAR